MNAITTTQYEVTADTTDSLLTSWIEFVDVNEATARTYMQGVRCFLEYMHQNGVVTPTRATVIEWRDAMMADHEAGTVQTYMVAVRLFSRWIAQEGYGANFADHVKAPRVHAGHRRDALTAEQARQVMAATGNARDRAMVALMLVTGLRTVEVARADIQDIKHVFGQTVLFIQGKGRTDKTSEYVRIPAQVESLINAMLAERGEVAGDEPLFASISNHNHAGRMATGSISRIAKTVLRKAGIDSTRITAHSMRHTAATLALLNGASLREVQTMLRHSSPTVTQVYLHDIEAAQNRSESCVANAIF